MLVGKINAKIGEKSYQGQQYDRTANIKSLMGIEVNLQDKRRKKGTYVAHGTKTVNQINHVIIQSKYIEIVKGKHMLIIIKIIIF